MEYFVFFVGCLLVVAALVLAVEVRKLADRVHRERAGGERSFAALELAVEETMQELEQRAQALLQELERREERLRRLAAEVERGSPRASGEPSAPSGGRAAGRPDEPRTTQATGAVRERPGVPPTERSSEPAAGARRPRISAEGAAHSRAAQVAEMDRAGAGVLEIARAVGMGRGEVELILRLQKSRGVR